MMPMLIFTAISFANAAAKSMILNWKSRRQTCQADLRCIKKMFITAAYAKAVTIKNKFDYEGVIYYD